MGKAEILNQAQNSFLVFKSVTTTFSGENCVLGRRLAFCVYPQNVAFSRVLQAAPRIFPEKVEYWNELPGDILEI